MSKWEEKQSEVLYRLKSVDDRLTTIDSRLNNIEKNLEKIISNSPRK